MLEKYLSELTFLTAVFTFITSVALYPQAYKMFKRKSSADVAVSMYLLLLPSFVVFALFGFSLNSLSLAFANIVGLVGTILIIALYYMYRKKSKK
ncbi:MAG: hypothetical protein HY438_00815 [DPANN group archaeon]|nr:hypothetical protein [DPANN group archaeon]